MERLTFTDRQKATKILVAVLADIWGVPVTGITVTIQNAARETYEEASAPETIYDEFRTKDVVMERVDGTSVIRACAVLFGNIDWDRRSGDEPASLLSWAEDVRNGRR